MTLPRLELTEDPNKNNDFIIFRHSSLKSKKNKQIEVVYYHDNGSLSQTGYYTFDGKLDGEWISYNTEGEQVTVAHYDNGKKVGKWLFWDADNLKEVDYTNNTIASVSDWTRSSQLATRE